VEFVVVAREGWGGGRVDGEEPFVDDGSFAGVAASGEELEEKGEGGKEEEEERVKIEKKRKGGGGQLQVEVEMSRKNPRTYFVVVEVTVQFSFLLVGRYMFKLKPTSRAAE